MSEGIIEQYERAKAAMARVASRREQARLALRLISEWWDDPEVQAEADRTNQHPDICGFSAWLRKRAGVERGGIVTVVLNPHPTKSVAEVRAEERARRRHNGQQADGRGPLHRLPVLPRHLRQGSPCSGLGIGVGGEQRDEEVLAPPTVTSPTGRERRRPTSAGSWIGSKSSASSPPRRGSRRGATRRATSTRSGTSWTFPRPRRTARRESRPLRAGRGGFRERPSCSPTRSGPRTRKRWRGGARTPRGVVTRTRPRCHHNKTRLLPQQDPVVLATMGVCCQNKTPLLPGQANP